MALVSLKDGTAEGCHEPLNYARHMLPLVRRDHFYIEGEEPEPEHEEDTYFTREHPLDQAITRLYAAVGTALDEYRAQAQDKYDDHVGAEEILEFGQDGTFSEISEQSRDVAQTAEAENEKLTNIVEAGSESSEQLRRQIQDGANIAHSIQSQIRLKPVVARWYDSASRALGKLPDVMIKTASNMRVGTDIAEIWANEWSAFKRRLRSLAFDQIRGLADALAATGEKLKKDRRDNRKPVERQRDPEVVEAETQVKAMLLAGTPLPPDLAAKAETLVFQKKDGPIKRPGDLLLCTALHTLGAFNMVFAAKDIQMLGQMPSLVDLSLNVNSDEDLAALAKLDRLTGLAMNANNISDLSPISSLIALKKLTLLTEEVSDLSALTSLTSLTALSVESKTVEDISHIRDHTNLTELSLITNEVKNLSALDNLHRLTSLTINANLANDVSFLANLTDLTNLSMQTKEVHDVSALRGLSKLTTLSISANHVSDISALETLTQLTRLSMTINAVQDLTPLGSLTQLTRLSMSAASASDLTALGNLAQLTGLVIVSSIATDLSPLAELDRLTSLSIHARSASDLTPIGALRALETLACYIPNPNNFDPLWRLSNLTSLAAVGLNDLSHIQALEKIAQLRVSSVPDLDLAPLAHVHSLKELTLDQVGFRNRGALQADVALKLIGESRPL